MNIFKTAALAATFALGASPAFAACAVSLANDVQPIFDFSCVACHQDSAPGGGMSLQGRSMIANTVNVASTEVASMPRITPGDTANSYLFRKLEGTHGEVGGSGEQMPLGGALEPEELEAIRSWIADCGAAE